MHLTIFFCNISENYAGNGIVGSDHCYTVAVMSSATPTPAGWFMHSSGTAFDAPVGATWPNPTGSSGQLPFVNVWLAGKFCRNAHPTGYDRTGFY